MTFHRMAIRPNHLINGQVGVLPHFHPTPVARLAGKRSRAHYFIHHLTSGSEA